MSADPDSGAGPGQAQAGDGGTPHVDARQAVGVQIGKDNTQIIYNYSKLTWADGAALPPLVSFSGTVDSPYRGLRAFEEQDAPFFFGREAATTDVLKRMSRCVDGTGLLVVSGVSGAGKSAPALPEICQFYFGQITEGAIRVGELLPPAHHVAEKHGTSIATARRGLRLLAKIGFAQAVPGHPYIALHPERKAGQRQVRSRLVLALTGRFPAPRAGREKGEAGRGPS